MSVQGFHDGRRTAPDHVVDSSCLIASLIAVAAIVAGLAWFTAMYTG